MNLTSGEDVDDSAPGFGEILVQRLGCADLICLSKAYQEYADIAAVGMAASADRKNVSVSNVWIKA